MREAVIDIMSGSVAGMVSTAVGHPFDTLKDLDLTKYRFGPNRSGTKNRFWKFFVRILQIIQNVESRERRVCRYILVDMEIQ